MNGAGEVYLSFDYRGMLVRQFTAPDLDDEEGLTVELYDMGTPADAFGIFARNRGGGEAGVGQGSEYRSGYLLFWRDRIFGTIYADRETDASRTGVLCLGRAVAESVGRDGELPDLLQLLPEDGLLPGSERYFHLYTDLNQHYFIADDNVLDLGHDTDAVLARYGPDDPPRYLLIVRYPDAESAAVAFESYTAAFQPENPGGDPLELEDGTWTTAAHRKSFVAAVYDAESKKTAKELLQHATDLIKGTEGGRP